MRRHGATTDGSPASSSALMDSPTRCNLDLHQTTARFARLRTLTPCMGTDPDASAKRCLSCAGQPLRYLRTRSGLLVWSQNSVIFPRSVEIQKLAPDAQLAGQHRYALPCQHPVHRSPLEFRAVLPPPSPCLDHSCLHSLKTSPNSGVSIYRRRPKPVA
jgi:hypothetical protein